MAKEPTREEDERRLLMLEARDLGMSATQIGVRFGVTRNSVLGVFKRVDDAVKAAEMCPPQPTRP